MDSSHRLTHPRQDSTRLASPRAVKRRRVFVHLCSVALLTKPQYHARLHPCCEEHERRFRPHIRQRGSGIYCALLLFSFSRETLAIPYFLVAAKMAPQPYGCLSHVVKRSPFSVELQT